MSNCAPRFAQGRRRRFGGSYKEEPESSGRGPLPFVVTVFWVKGVVLPRCVHDADRTLTMCCPVRSPCLWPCDRSRSSHTWLDDLQSEEVRIW